MPAIPIIKRQLVVELVKRGDTYRQIAQRLNISHSAVSKIVSKHKKGLPLTNMTKLCTPSKLNNREKTTLLFNQRKRLLKLLIRYEVSAI